MSTSDEDDDKESETKQHTDETTRVPFWRRVLSFLPKEPKNTSPESHTSSSNAPNFSVDNVQNETTSRDIESRGIPLKNNDQTSEQNGQPCTSAPNGIQSSNGLQDEDLEGVNSGRQPLERHSEDNAIAKNGSSDSSSDDPNNTSQPHSQELGGDQKKAQPTVAFAFPKFCRILLSHKIHPERIDNEGPKDNFFRYLRQNFRETLQVRCFLINLENSCCFHPIPHFFRYCHEKFFLGIYMEYAAVRRNYTRISCCCGCCGTCLITLITLLGIIGILIGFINLLWKIGETLGH